MSGLCTGALAAAAVSCCNTVSELLPVAVQTVLVALRTGICAVNAAKAVDPSEGKWSIVLHGLSQREVSDRLQEFSHSRVSCTGKPSSYSFRSVWASLTPREAPSHHFPALCQRLRRELVDNQRTASRTRAS